MGSQCYQYDAQPVTAARLMTPSPDAPAIPTTASPPDHLLCSICVDVFEDPTLHGCGLHAFCRGCLESLAAATHGAASRRSRPADPPGAPPPDPLSALPPRTPLRGVRPRRRARVGARHRARRLRVVQPGRPPRRRQSARARVRARASRRGGGQSARAHAVAQTYGRAGKIHIHRGGAPRRRTWRRCAKKATRKRRGRGRGKELGNARKELGASSPSFPTRLLLLRLPAERDAPVRQPEHVHLSPVPRGRPRSHGRGGPPRVPPGRERAGEAPRVGPRRARIGIPRRRLPHLRQHAVGRPDVPDARYRRTREAQAQIRSARLRRSRGGRGREPEKSDAKESRGGGRREMKKTKRLFLSSCLPRQAVGGRGGGRARERRGDRKERERKNDATRRCVCQRREKGPIGEASAATRETKIDTRPREKASPFHQVAARCLAV